MSAEADDPAITTEQSEATPRPVRSEQARAAHLDQAMLRLDRVLLVVVLLFTFLLASFPVRNSDFWLHLATGRLLASGEYTIGIDPFDYTTVGLYWVIHAWLFDLLLY